MSYFVWNKIDHAVVRGNDKKEGNDWEKSALAFRKGEAVDGTLRSQWTDNGTLASSLTVRAKPVP